MKQTHQDDVPPHQHHRLRPSFLSVRLVENIIRGPRFCRGVPILLLGSMPAAGRGHFLVLFCFLTGEEKNLLSLMRSVKHREAAAAAAPSWQHGGQAYS